MVLCCYGCGKEGKFQLRSGRWCCSSHYKKCPAFKSGRLATKESKKRKAQANVVSLKYSREGMDLSYGPEEPTHEERLRNYKRKRIYQIFVTTA